MGKYPYTKNCINCDEVFTISFAWAASQKFCSHKCNTDSKRKYHREENCLRCGKELVRDQRKFCSRSCRTVVQNENRIYKSKPKNQCLVCGKLTKTHNEKF